MERRRFIQNCCYIVIGLPVMASVLQSCEAIYYATTSHVANRLIIARSEFWKIKKDKKVERDFVLIKITDSQFPISLYKITENKYTASLLKCTHKGCELNVGGGIYSCPCHGSEFTIAGEVIEGPATDNLKTFKTESDDKNIYIDLS